MKLGVPCQGAQKRYESSNCHLDAPLFDVCEKKGHFWRGSNPFEGSNISRDSYNPPRFLKNASRWLLLVYRRIWGQCLLLGL